MNFEEKAVYNFVNDSYNCSEGIVAAISEHQGLEKDTFVGLATSFGGGIGSSGNICGALTGGLMMNGYLLKMKNNPKSIIRDSAKEMYENFENKFGSVNCFDLTNHSCNSANEVYDIRNCSKYIEFIVKEINKD